MAIATQSAAGTRQVVTLTGATDLTDAGWQAARAAKARGDQAGALTALAEVVARLPGFAPAGRMREVVEKYPTIPFTYSRVLDFILAKGWGFYDYFAEMENLVRRFDLRTGVELGVSYGFLAQHLMEACPELQLVGVDAYSQMHAGAGYENAGGDAHFAEQCERTRAYLEPTGRWSLLRMTTHEAAGRYEGQADFVFVDAEHTYEAARQDIHDWYPKVRPGGIFCGHDYGQPIWPGVKRAVDELLPQWGMKATAGLGTLWWAQKGA